jgi:general secretion pathway protein H
VLTALPAETVKIKTSPAGTKGFTLLELIIVLFIAGMAVAVVVFSAARIHENSIFNDEARRLYQTLKHAREISLMDRIDVAVKVDAPDNKYWIDYGNGKTSDEHSLHEGITISGDKDVVFSPKGSSSGGAIKIVNAKGQEYTIEVDPILGMPKIKRL